MTTKKAANAAFFFEKPLLAVFLFLLPIGWVVPNHYLPWTSAWADGASIFVFLVVCVLLIRTPECSFKLPGFLLLSVIACALGFGIYKTVDDTNLFRADAYLAIAYLTLLLLAISVGKMLSHARVFEALVIGVLAFSIISAIFSLAQFTGYSGLGFYLADLPYGARPFGNFAQPNNFSTACFLGLAAIIYFGASKRVHAAVLFFLLVILEIGVVLAGSRTAWLQFMVVSFYAVVFRRRVANRRVVLWIALTILVFFLFRISIPVISEYLLLAEPRSLESQLDSGLRLRMWEMAMTAISEKPWLGYGWQQIGFAQQQVALQFPPHGEQFEHSHNLVLDLLLTYGVPVGVAIIILFIVWFFGVVRKSQGEYADFSIWAVLLLLTHSIVEYPLDYAYFLVIFGILVGVIDGGLCVCTTGLRVWPKWCAALTIALLVTFFIILGKEYLKAESRFRELRLDSIGIGLNSPQAGVVGYMFLDHLDAYMDFIATPATVGMSAGQLNEMRKISHRFGYPPVLFRFALAAGLNGYSAEAIRTLNILCHVHRAERCVEAVSGWSSLRKIYPVLPTWEHPEMAPS